MKRRMFVPILLASIALAACGGEDEADTAGGTSGSQTSPEEGLVALETDNFTVLFPEDHEVSAEDTAGMDTAVYTAQDDETMAVVAWTANPAGIDIPAESVLEGNLTGAGGSLGEVTELEIDGWPAQETASEIGAGNGATWLTVVVTDSGILQVQYAVLGDVDVADVPAVYEQMRDSIEVTP